MSSLDTKRHDALFNKSAFDLPIHLIGVGGVGSHVALQLGKLGVGTHPLSSVDFYDGDIIEAHNVSNQAYLTEDVGSSKATMLQERFTNWSGGNTATAHEMFVREHLPLSGIVFLCLDSMEARKEICEESLWRNPEVKLLVDTRMDASNAVCYAIDPNNEDHIAVWNERWFPDDLADNLAGCDGHLSVITAVTMTAALAVQQFIAYVQRGNVDLIPNYVRFSLDTMEAYHEYWKLPES